ncbi:MAG: tetratricopeptide repeat protein [Myxococcales bacterium]
MAAATLALLAAVAPRIARAALDQGGAVPPKSDQAMAPGATEPGGGDEEADDSRGEKTLPAAVERAITEKERQVVGARQEGIRLLEEFLRSSPRSRETAEALYKLAELYWEDSKAAYLDKMGAYQRAITDCRKDRAACPRVPRRPPRLELAQAQNVYDRLIQEYPRFRKIDTVLYLYAFSLRDQGRLAESVKYFQVILDRFPRSRFTGDAWMAIAEYRFYEQQNYRSSLSAYEKVLEHPRSPLYALALFKTAWCYWKLGDTSKSALRFKDVLDLAKKKAGNSPAEQKRAEELQGQAMEYLVELFTEDDTKSAQDAFEFLSQIGGKEYSQKILARLAETVFDQTRYERAAEAYRLLNSLDPQGVEAPDHQRRIVECRQLLGDDGGAVLEMRKLATDYGPRSAWAAANKDRPNALAHARQLAEEQIRSLAKTLHAEAQNNEKQNKVLDKGRYARAAEAYEFYLTSFPDARDSVELRYLRADVLYFKLGRLADAGNEYLLVGKTKPPGQYHKDALLQAMTAFEKLRKPAGDKREITESDRKFAEAADLYATLFPKDKEIVTVIYKNGQFFFDYGDYDEAVKRFGLIIEGHPDDPNAGPAGDRILEALAKGKDYENIEQWARRLKKTKPFAARSEQDRLDRMIVVAVMKSGEKYAAQGKFAQAAGFFLRVPREYPRDPKAPQALHNAATIFERGKKPEEAVAAYKELAEKYPQAPEAAEALFTAAHIEESVASYDRAALLYEQVVTRFPQSKHGAEALRNAGILRQTLGENEKAIQHFGDYARRYKDRGDARELAFQVAVVRERQQDWKSAAQSFEDYARTHPGDARNVEALTRGGDAHLKAGNDGKAKEGLSRALALANGGGHARANGGGGGGGDTDSRYWAAQARYLQGQLIFREYERVKIAGKPRQLARVLDEKAKLLEQSKHVFLDVVTYQSPEWATAALLRIGQGYEAFAQAMRQAPVPKDLNADEKQVYRDELEKLTVVIEDKAIAAYKSGYGKALEIGVYNKHTQDIRHALTRLDEANYPKELEVRAGLRAGEPPIRIGKLEEVRRDR